MSRAALEQLFQRCWSLKSSTLWSPDCPARGQCGVTALVVQDHFGGDILKTRVGEQWHFYNFIAGERWDITAGQFSTPPAYDDVCSSRTEAFADTTEAPYSYLAGEVARAVAETSGEGSATS